ncbi:carbonic anhydrase [Coprinopsis marcescibilis]|uniref:Carbonic anhydrase n=1 Tax=Coprinopsis marcescibilis TaxID=230819 RepID=A0A5C3KXX3_COPMA|nr:carbonic anhydrase [Coprinopsis marcescibilis]
MVSFRFSSLFVMVTASLTLAHSFHDVDSLFPRQSESAVGPELQVLAEGNKIFRQSTDPELLKKLTFEGQTPSFMYFGCVDSRVNDGTIFNAKPGTLFTERNIANQFHSSDTNAEATLAFSVAVLGVRHVVVMGHYGCGGIGAAIASRPLGNIDAAGGAIQSWIEPIRELFESSTRPEIVELRESIKGRTDVPFPDVREPGYRALVEENIKQNVVRVARSNIIVNHYALLAEKKENKSDVFIHGWVYDVENGEVRDLGVSVGPPGKPIPALPWEKVAGAGKQFAHTHDSTKEHCQDKCKSTVAHTLIKTKY